MTVFPLPTASNGREKVGVDLVFRAEEPSTGTWGGGRKEAVEWLRATEMGGKCQVLDGRWLSVGRVEAAGGPKPDGEDEAIAIAIAIVVAIAIVSKKRHTHRETDTHSPNPSIHTITLVKAISPAPKE
jgi:hypothetical protein